LLDPGDLVGPAQDGAERDGEDVNELVAATLRAARVGQLREVIPDRRRRHGVLLRAGWEIRPHDYTRRALSSYPPLQRECDCPAHVPNGDSILTRPVDFQPDF